MSCQTVWDVCPLMYPHGKNKGVNQDEDNQMLENLLNTGTIVWFRTIQSSLGNAWLGPRTVPGSENIQTDTTVTTLSDYADFQLEGQVFSNLGRFFTDCSAPQALTFPLQYKCCLDIKHRGVFKLFGMGEGRKKHSILVFLGILILQLQ